MEFSECKQQIVPWVFWRQLSHCSWCLWLQTPRCTFPGRAFAPTGSHLDFYKNQSITFWSPNGQLIKKKEEYIKTTSNKSNFMELKNSTTLNVSTGTILHLRQTNVSERTPSLPHGIHSPSTLWVAVCLHQGKLESDLGQGQTYSTHGIPWNTWEKRGKQLCKNCIWTVKVICRLGFCSYRLRALATSAGNKCAPYDSKHTNLDTHVHTIIVTLEVFSKQQMTGGADEGRCDDFMVEHRLQK